MLELFLLLLVCVLSLFVMFSMSYSIWTSVPYVPTPQKLVQKMVEIADLRAEQTVYDCGAGDARLLIAAKKACPGIRAIGFEVIPSVYLWGKLRIWWSGVDVEYHWKNALKNDYSNADRIFMYLSPHLMYQLEDKFNRELKPGTRIISHAFRFSTEREPVEEHEIFSRRQRYLCVYEW